MSLPSYCTCEHLNCVEESVIENDSSSPLVMVVHLNNQVPTVGYPVREVDRAVLTAAATAHCAVSE